MVVTPFIGIGIGAAFMTTASSRDAKQGRPTNQFWPNQTHHLKSAVNPNY